jgi:uncharacterized peroxidase-related enzyme
VDRISADWRSAGLPDADVALCEYAEKLTLRPSSVGREDIDRLRAVGLDDEGISSAAQVVAYFNYINRIADGLGVPLEDWLGEDGRPKEP